MHVAAHNQQQPAQPMFADNDNDYTNEMEACGKSSLMTAMPQLVLYIDTFTSFLTALCLTETETPVSMHRSCALYAALPKGLTGTGAILAPRIAQMAQISPCPQRCPCSCQHQLCLAHHCWVCPDTTQQTVTAFCKLHNVQCEQLA